MNAAPSQVTTAYKFDPATLNAMLREDYAAWRAGIFRLYVLHPQKIDTLRDVPSDQLMRRQVFISRMGGRAYKTEWHNIKRILKERDELAQKMLDAGKAQQAQFSKPLTETERINKLADTDLLLIEALSEVAA